MTDPLTLEMKMRQKLAEAEGTKKSTPEADLVNDDTDHEIMRDAYNYACGVADTIELLLPDVISWRKVREWLKDWALSMPIDDLEAVTGAKE